MNNNRDRYGRFSVEPTDLSGIRSHPFYNTWANMIQRCENANTPLFHMYGGRGITVCHEWHDSAVFLEWLENNGYRKGLDIDRIDNNKGYFPENCHCVTRKQNCRNTRRNRRFVINGENLAIFEIEEKFQITANTFRGRIRLGWNAERAATFPVRRISKSHS